jgi:hypothetical protein
MYGASTLASAGGTEHVVLQQVTEPRLLETADQLVPALAELGGGGLQVERARAASAQRPISADVIK